MKQILSALSLAFCLTSFANVVLFSDISKVDECTQKDPKAPSTYVLNATYQLSVIETKLEYKERSSAKFHNTFNVKSLPHIDAENPVQKTETKQFVFFDSDDGQALEKCNEFRTKLLNIGRSAGAKI